MNGTVTVEFVGVHQLSSGDIVERPTTIFRFTKLFSDKNGQRFNFCRGFVIIINGRYIQQQGVNFMCSGRFKSAKFVVNDSRVDALGGLLAADLARRVAKVLNTF